MLLGRLFGVDLKNKGYSSPIFDMTVGSGADPGLYTVSPQVTSHKPSTRMPLLSIRPAVTFPTTQHHLPLFVVLSFIEYSKQIWQNYVA